MRKIAEILRAGGVGVMATDTIYGLMALALDKKAVQRVSGLKKRNPKKPFLILISDFADLKLFGVRPQAGENRLRCFWPGKISVVLPCPGIKKELSYLKPLNGTLAFRMPKPKWLRQLLKKTGPLIAPSANPEGEKPALTIRQSRRYFGEEVDFYWDRGKKQSQPSTIIGFERGKIKVLRQGAIKVNEN